MESICVGAFLLLFLAAAAAVASPISLATGAITYALRKNRASRTAPAAAVAILTFLFIVLIAFIVLLIWNPRI